MKKICLPFLAAVLVTCCLTLLLAPAASANNHRGITADSATIEGRWDITLSMSGKEYPSWLEVVLSGAHTLVGRYVGTAGSARPISKINFSGGKMHFAIPPQWDKGENDMVFDATLQGDSLTGTLTAADGKSYNWVAHRAPLLRRQKKWYGQNPLPCLMVKI